MSKPVNFQAFSRRYLRFLSAGRRLELFPPFWLMGVKVVEMADDWSRVRLHLPLNWRSRNLGGAMFGGFQASLADPIAALACARRFPEYDVWTRKLTLDFRRPGLGDLELRFEFPVGIETAIGEELRLHQRSDPRFEYGFFLADGTQCTAIHSTVAIRERGYGRRYGVGSAS
ncbi:MAG: PaaI family thioesterase [Thiotrichales bacterium]